MLYSRSFQSFAAHDAFEGEDMMQYDDYSDYSDYNDYNDYNDYSDYYAAYFDDGAFGEYDDFADFQLTEYGLMTNVPPFDSDDEFKYGDAEGYHQWAADMMRWPEFECLNCKESQDHDYGIGYNHRRLRETE